VKGSRIWVPLVVLLLLVAAGGVGWASFETYLNYRVVQVLVDGKSVKGLVPAIIIEGTTMIPLRAVAEAMDAEVGWDDRTYTVSITRPADLVATVNGRDISQSALYRRMVESEGQRVLSALIREELITEAAVQAGVSISEQMVQAEIDQIKRQIGSEAGFQEALRQHGISLTQLARDIHWRQTVKALVLPLAESQVSTERVTAHFEQNEQRLRWPDLRVKARHILVETEEEAQAVRVRLSQGEAFAELAQELSLDPGSWGNGGDLGFFQAGMMVPEFEQAAFGLALEQVSAPVQTDFGYHIIEVTDRIEGRAVSTQDALSQARAELVQGLLTDLMPVYVSGLEQSAQVQIKLPTNP